MHVFADGISKVTLSNGNLRIMLTQRGPDDTTVEAGTLIIPANQASNFMNGLANSLKELDSKLKEAREQTQQ
ncbi:conserved hypothetical protein [Desulfonatronospira thiodismutans ASO3-1]|uniref:Uncharacterized protein n=1 Tax=Desulfonatronospira thiodismutans ASO3-1 TaxID=555779 RepID=D6SV41_9BACT|nr:hypothetical protein [Desulfonatronospira thiodismutans]EFI32797.1 conserved hypothetical protein [Desulfonatronospira thiodismutans ASO3-1]